MNWQKVTRLRLYLGESDKCQGEPAYEVLLKTARAKKIYGATVFRGVMGYGRNSLIHTSKILRLSEDLPFVVEIIDDNSKIEAFLDDVLLIVPNSLVTKETIEALFP